MFAAMKLSRLNLAIPLIYICVYRWRRDFAAYVKLIIPFAPRSCLFGSCKDHGNDTGINVANCIETRLRSRGPASSILWGWTSCFVEDWMAGGLQRRRQQRITVVGKWISRTDITSAGALWWAPVRLSLIYNGTYSPDHPPLAPFSSHSTPLPPSTHFPVSTRDTIPTYEYPPIPLNPSAPRFPPNPNTTENPTLPFRRLGHQLLHW